MQRVLKIGYRLAYIVGLAALVLSLVLAGSVERGFAQGGGWSVTHFCGGFRLTTPAHPDILIEAEYGPSPQGPWSGTQTWNRSASGPNTYNFNYNPPAEWDVKVIVYANGNILYRNIQKAAACPTPTLPPPPTFTPTPGDSSPTPDTPTPTVELPTDTPEPPTETPTEEPPTDTPTVTPTGPTDTPTVTPTGPTPTPSSTSTPTDTPTPTATSTPIDIPPTTPVPGGPTDTPIQPPPGGGGEFVPVTGIDLSGGSALNTRLLQNVGIGLIGLALVLHGISIRTRNKDK